MMKTLLRIEEAFLFLLSIFLFSQTGYAWWWFPLLLFAPDIGMLGYFLNPKAGAYVYNFIHHRALAVTLYVLGALLSIHLLQLIGTILFAHSSLDRAMHFGLKYADRFEHTHLGG
jgi:hypothetical protein